MAQDEDLIPVTREDPVSSLSFALRFDGRRRIHQPDDFMARVAAKHLADYLDCFGFVVSKRPVSNGSAHRHPYPQPPGSDE